MTELEKPVSGQEVADLLTIVLIETVASLSANSTEADEKLEDLAGQLLTMAEGMIGAARSALLIRTTAQQLIQTETGAG